MVVTVVHAEVAEGSLQAQKLLGVPMEELLNGGEGVREEGSGCLLGWGSKKELVLFTEKDVLAKGSIIRCRNNLP